MNYIEFSANIFTKEKYSDSAGDKRLYESKDCPDFEVQSFNGNTFLVLSGTLSGHTETTWDGNPKLTYDKKVEIKLGLVSCEKLVNLLQEKGLIHIQLKPTK